ncbi:MAG: hypothetical protein EXS64_00675 [Candidatus Latescibacteria bacterium]|nr:hypothetical protein [Candidatus Latescibacterota bacterium]
MQKEYVPPPPLKPGYFLGQEAFSVPKNALFRRMDPYFKTFLTEENATRYFEQIAGKVDGLDYCTYWYEPADAEMARRIAEIGRAHGVDMWTGIRWHKQFRDMPVVPGDCAAWTMDEAGRISPALWEQRNHTFDYLNPRAVDWMMEVLEARYWPHLKGPVNGLFFPECRVTTPDVPYRRNGLKTWTLHAYSPAVLEAWRAYCAKRDVRWQGAQVDRFPVPLAHMTRPHPEATVHVPDDRPGAVPAFTRFVDIPRGTPVWLAWEDFLCERFHEVFIHRIAARVNRYHADNPDWRGVCFFNNDVTALDYRNFQTRSARTGFSMGYWPQGRRMGVDLPRLLKDPEVTCFISETVQSVRDYLFYEENPLSHGMALAREAGRPGDYGFMVHYCDAWGQVGDIRAPGGGIMDDVEEDLRWEMIHKYRPPVFSYFSIPTTLVREGAWYQKEAADRFWGRVEEYRRSFGRGV